MPLDSPSEFNSIASSQPKIIIIKQIGVLRDTACTLKPTMQCNTPVHTWLYLVHFETLFWDIFLEHLFFRHFFDTFLGHLFSHVFFALFDTVLTCFGTLPTSHVPHTGQIRPLVYRTTYLTYHHCDHQHHHHNMMNNAGIKMRCGELLKSSE